MNRCRLGSSSPANPSRFASKCSRWTRAGPAQQEEEEEEEASCDDEGRAFFAEVYTKDLELTEKRLQLLKNCRFVDLSNCHISWSFCRRMIKKE